MVRSLRRCHVVITFVLAILVSAVVYLAFRDQPKNFWSAQAPVQEDVL